MPPHIQRGRHQGQEELSLLVNNDQCPPYITTTSDHNGYEAQTRFPLGLYHWTRHPTDYGKGKAHMHFLGHGKAGNPNNGREFSVQDIMEEARERRIKTIIITGCKTSPTP